MVYNSSMDTQEHATPSAITDTLVQMAAALLVAAGGTLPMSRLASLLYLAERTSLDRDRELIAGDTFVLTAKGPAPTSLVAWLDAPYAITIPLPVTRDRFDRLSDTQIALLTQLVQDTADLDEPVWQTYLEVHCPEIRSNPTRPRPVPALEILRALKISPKMAEALARRLDIQRAARAA
jgi:hypothetical protein